jgi:hypothetical protein
LVAAAILGVKAVLGLWAALIVLSASPTRPHNFLGYPVSRRGVLVGLLLVALAAVTMAVAVGLARWRPGARWAAFGLEAVAVGLALSRLPSRPRVAWVALALSAAVVLLLAVPVGRRPRPPPPTTPDPGVPGAEADETWA